MVSGPARRGRKLADDECWRCGASAVVHRLSGERGAAGVTGCTLTQEQAVHRPCVASDDDRRHEMRPTTLLGPRLGWWCATCRQKRKKTRKAVNRAKRRERIYELSEEDAQAIREDMPKNKNGVPVCPGCEWATGASKALAVDHDHAKEAAGEPMRDCVRGFLCSTCNQMIEKYGVEGLRRLIAYILDPPAPRALAKLDARKRASVS